MRENKTTPTKNENSFFVGAILILLLSHGRVRGSTRLLARKNRKILTGCSFSEIAFLVVGSHNNLLLNE